MVWVRGLGGSWFGGLGWLVVRWWVVGWVGWWFGGWLVGGLVVAGCWLLVGGLVWLVVGGLVVWFVGGWLVVGGLVLWFGWWFVGWLGWVVWVGRRLDLITRSGPWFNNLVLGSSWGVPFVGLKNCFVYKILNNKSHVWRLDLFG